MANTLGIHWAHTTYGTWLPGDARGSWHDGRLIEGDPFLKAEAAAKMNHDAVVLSPRDRQIVAVQLGATVRECRHRVLAATVQAVHMHLVFAPLAEDIKRVIARLKDRTASGVFADHRKRGEPTPRSLWTGGRFPVFLFEARHLYNAIEYVRDHNRRAGMPADPYDWIDPLYPPRDEQEDRFRGGPVLELPPT